MDAFTQLVVNIQSDSSSIQLRALQSLVELSSRNHDQDRERILNQISPFLPNLLKSDDILITEKAVECVRYLARNSVNKTRLEKIGVIELLKNLLLSPSEKAKTSSAGALWSLAVNPENKMKIASSGAIPLLIQVLRTGSTESKTAAAGALWNLSVNNELELEIVKLGALPPLIALLKSGSHDGKNRAAQALSNLCYNSTHKQLAAKAGAVEPLIEVLKKGPYESRANACSALWNLAVNLENKSLIAQHGGIEALITVLREGSSEAQLNASAALATLTINHDENQDKIGTSVVLQEIVQVLTRKNIFTSDMCTALNNLTKNSKNVETVIKVGLPNILKAFKKEKNKTNHERLCGCLRNLTLSESFRKHLASTGIIEAFIDTLNGDMESSKDEAAAGLHNLAQDNQIALLLLEKGAKSALENTQNTSTNKPAQVRAAGVLRLIEQVESSPVETNTQSGRGKKYRTPSTKIVSLSFSHIDSPKVKRIADLLRDLGYSVNLEPHNDKHEKVHRRLRFRLIENSVVILLCLSKNYQSNPMCQKEVEGFTRMKKTFVGVLIDSTFRPQTWLKAFIGSQVPVIFNSNQSQQIEEIVHIIRYADQSNTLGNGNGNVKCEPSGVEISETQNVSTICAEWNFEQISKWLNQYSLSHYIDRMAEEGFDGYAIDQLVELWKNKNEQLLFEMLREIGVKSLSERLKFRQALSDLSSGFFSQ